MLNELRDWSNCLAEWVIVLILLLEYFYDKNKDEAKKQKKTRTTKKVTQAKDGSTVTEESQEVSEPMNQEEKK